MHILCAFICPIPGFDNFAPIFNHFGSSNEVSNFFKVGQLSRGDNMKKRAVTQTYTVKIQVDKLN